MTDDEAEEIIARGINELWEAWCASGGLDQVEQTLGPVKKDPWRRVFEAGWKLGASESARIGRELQKIIKSNETPETGNN